MSDHTVDTFNITPTLRVRIECDMDSESPASWDNFGEITYNARGREVLGTEAISNERFEEIGRGIDDGSLIGLPVYAYVHSGSTIATTPFSCPWDSGRSGWVYATREAAIKEFGKKILTPKVKAHALHCLQGLVDTCNTYLMGEVYGYIVERAVLGGWEELDSCWGFYGLDYCKEAGGDAAQSYITELETA